MKAVLLRALVSLFLLVLSGDATWAADLKQAVKELADQLAKGVPAQPYRTVAVMDFLTMEGTTSEFGQYLADQLTAELARLQPFRIVDRRRLKRLLATLKLGMPDLLDPAKAGQAGAWLGLDALVVGMLFEVGSTVEIEARMIESRTGGVLGGAATSLPAELAHVPHPTAKSLTEPGLTLTVERVQPLPEEQRQNLLLEKGAYLLVDLVFRNTSEKPMMIALAHGAKASLLDEAGKQYGVVRLLGLILDLPLEPGRMLRHSLVFPRPQGKPFQLVYPGFETIEGLVVAEE